MKEKENILSNQISGKKNIFFHSKKKNFQVLKYFFLFFRSFGITLWEIFTHCDYQDEPYENVTDDLKIFLKSGKRLPDRSFPFKLYEVMCLCWNADPTQRPSFHQLSEFLQKFK